MIKISFYYFVFIYLLYFMVKFRQFLVYFFIFASCCLPQTCLMSCRLLDSAKIINISIKNPTLFTFCLLRPGWWRFVFFSCTTKICQKIFYLFFSSCLPFDIPFYFQIVNLFFGLQKKKIWYDNDRWHEVWNFKRKIMDGVSFNKKKKLIQTTEVCM